MGCLGHTVSHWPLNPEVEIPGSLPGDRHFYLPTLPCLLEARSLPGRTAAGSSWGKASSTYTFLLTATGQGHKWEGDKSELPDWSLSGTSSPCTQWWRATTCPWMPFSVQMPNEWKMTPPNKPSDIQVVSARQAAGLPVLLKNGCLQEDGRGWPILFLKVGGGVRHVKRLNFKFSLYTSSFSSMAKSDEKRNEKFVGIQKLMSKHKRKLKYWSLMRSITGGAFCTVLGHCV